MNLPQDPAMLLSVVNMKLRDSYPSLQELCRSEDVDQGALVEKLSGIGYVYRPQGNQFVRGK